MSFKIYHGDCLETLRKAPDNFVDAIVTDPPYGLSFMGKKWDYDVPSVEIWKECLRVLKPGGHLLAFGGTRTYHRLVVAIEDAGFEIRDQIQWIYSQGFPKSQNIQKEGLKKGQCCGCETEPQYPVQTVSNSDLSPTLSASQTGLVLQSDLQESDVSPQGQAHGTGVNEGSEQPGLEGRNNFQTQQGELRGSEVRSVSARVSGNGAKGRVRDGASLSHGQTLEQTTNTNGSGSPQRPQHPQQPTKQSRTVAGQPKSQNRRIGEACGECGKPVIPGGLGTALKPANEPICLARKPLSESTIAKNVLKWGTGGLNIDGSRVGTVDDKPKRSTSDRDGRQAHGFMSGIAADLAAQEAINSKARFPSNVILDEAAAEVLDRQAAAEVSRFFYVAKASKAERNYGLEGMPKGEPPASARSKPAPGRENALGQPRENFHPTVKPVKLMEYLCKLVTPPGGVVLDPFMGSGTTGVAALRNGFQFRGIEREEQYFYISQARLEKEQGDTE